MFEEGNRLKKEYGAARVFDFSLGNPDIDPPPAFHRVFLRLAEEDRRGSHGYMPNGGYPEVREALAAKASREQGVELDGSHIVMAVGAAGGLNVVFKSILDPGDEVIVPRPYFMEYRPYTANHGGVLVEADTTEDFSLDLGAIRAALSPRTKAVLINSPHNPTGRVYPAEDLEALGKLLAAWGEAGRRPYLIADEPYREICYDGIATPPVLAVYDESIVVSSYSKSLSLPGERIGYVAVGPKAADKEDLVNALIYATRVLGYVNAPALMQRIVAELTLARVDVDIYARRRAAFTAILDGAGISYARPEGAFYLFCRVPPRKTAEAPRRAAAPPGAPPPEDDIAFAELLKQHLILAVPGSGFGKPGWIRLAYCVDEEIIKASGPSFMKALEDWQS
jgi:aspartate aminotransferase